VVSLGPGHLPSAAWDGRDSARLYAPDDAFRKPYVNIQRHRVDGVRAIKVRALLSIGTRAGDAAIKS
jgi:hypothetical protein